MPRLTRLHTKDAVDKSLKGTHTKINGNKMTQNFVIRNSYDVLYKRFSPCFKFQLCKDLVSA